MITSDLGVFVALLWTVGTFMWLAEQKLVGRLFEFVPPILCIFITSMVLSNIGVLPEASEAYAWIKRYLMPFAIFLLMLSVNLSAIGRIGRLASVMVVAGMCSVTLGFVLSTAIFAPWLGEESWAPIVASYAGAIGGSHNLVAMAEAYDASPNILGAMIAVDSIVGYAFLALLVGLAAYKSQFNTWLRAKEQTVEVLRNLSLDHDQPHREVSGGGVAMILCVGLAAAVIGRQGGDFLSTVSSPEFLSPSIWTLIVVVTSGLALSLTPMSVLNAHGATRVAQIALYLIMAVLGSEARFTQIWEYRVFALYSPVLLLISAISMLFIGRVLRVPIVLVVTGLYANLGGTITNPILASAYDKSFVSTALLMAIATQVAGMYVPLLLAPVIRWVVL